MTTYIKRMRDLREDHDLTQTKIAKILGMSQTGYSKYETGENDIPTAVLIKLADFFDILSILFLHLQFLPFGIKTVLPHPSCESRRRTVQSPAPPSKSPTGKR